MFCPETRCEDIVISKFPKLFFVLVPFGISLHSTFVAMYRVVIISRSTESYNSLFIVFLNYGLILMFRIVWFRDCDFRFVVLQNKLNTVLESFNNKLRVFFWVYLPESEKIVCYINLCVFIVVFFQPFLRFFLREFVFREYYRLKMVHFKCKKYLLLSLWLFLYRRVNAVLNLFMYLC